MFDFNEKLCFCYYATSLPRFSSLREVTRAMLLRRRARKNLWEKDALKVNFSFFVFVLLKSSCISALGKTARNAIN